MKFIHAADLHIDSPLRGLTRIPDADANLLRGATRRALENLVTVCLDEEAELLLVAGDLFDGDWFDVHSGVFLIKQLARLRDVGTRVVLIEGNHDAAGGVLRRLHYPEQVHLLSHLKPESVIFDSLGVAVHGQGFQRRDVRDNLAANYPPPIAGLLNVGLLHTNATGSVDHDRYAPCSLTELVQHGYQYWALGHIHQRQILHEDPWVVYPGNLQGRHARECGAKGCLVVSASNGEVNATEFQPCDAARWETVEIDIGGLRDTEQLVELGISAMETRRAAAGTRALVLRLRLVGQGPLHQLIVAARESLHEKLRLAAAATDVWLEKLELATSTVSQTSPVLSPDLARIIESESKNVLTELKQGGGQFDELEALRRFIGSQLTGVTDHSDHWREWVVAQAAQTADFLLARLSISEDSER